MSRLDIPDPLFRKAVDALDAGDLAGLETLLAESPSLLRRRAECGDEGYFHRPYLLWFVAENPVRNGHLPANIVEVTRAILAAAEREGVETLPEQRDYALGLVASGRVARECGVQLPLIDLLVEAGARPDGALAAALPHRELAAAERLLERGARLTLAAAIGTGRRADAERLVATATPEERLTALNAAAFYGLPEMLAVVLSHGVDLDAYSTPAFHPHATALHQAVFSGKPDAVRLLVEAGARLDTPDRVHGATPLGWAEYCGKPEIAAYLRQRQVTPGA